MTNSRHLNEHEDITREIQKISMTDSTSTEIASDIQSMLQAAQAQHKHDWIELVPSLLKEGKLDIVLETPQSADILLKTQGRICKESTLQRLEELEWESFIENDYPNDQLHLLTIRDQITPNQKMCGYIFWRDVEKHEMKEWIDWKKLQKQIDGEYAALNLIEHKELLTEQIIDEQTPVLNSIINHPEDFTSNNNAVTLAKNIPKSLKKDNISAHWIKVELLCVDQDYRSRRIGTMLLACCLLWAAQHRQYHGIVHVAGGHNNVPAVHLYERFGFREAPKELFHPPNDNLYVLWDIYKTCTSLSKVKLDFHRGITHQ